MFRRWKRKPAPSSDAELVILSTASRRDELRVVFPRGLRGGAADKLLAVLKRKGLIETVHAPPIYSGQSR